jgi:hypothetical protein
VTRHRCACACAAGGYEIVERDAYLTREQIDWHPDDLESEPPSPRGGAVKGGHASQACSAASRRADGTCVSQRNATSERVSGDQSVDGKVGGGERHGERHGDVSRTRGDTTERTERRESLSSDKEAPSSSRRRQSVQAKSPSPAKSSQAKQAPKSSQLKEAPSSSRLRLGAPPALPEPRAKRGDERKVVRV